MRRQVKSAEIHRDSVIHRVMMLRFRPIAPKPAAEQAVSAAVKIIGARRKRKYVRVCGRRKTTYGAKTDRKIVNPSPTEKSRVKGDESSPEKKGTAVLQLIRSECENRTVQKNGNIAAGSGGNDGEVMNIKANTDFTATVAPETFGSVNKTWITVECVTDTIVDSGVRLGVSDWEKIKSLSGDTCPGFISDGSHKVVWVNEAYMKMVAGGNNNGNIMVWLGVKEELIPKDSPAFACRLRMSMETRQGYKWNRILACDVWRMEFAGFAWKLDVNTALGLGI